MDNFDLCFAWNWQYDADFTWFLQAACSDAGLSLLQVKPENLEWAIQSLAENQIAFQAFFDRASDADVRFLPLVQWAENQTELYLNPYGFSRRAWNKAVIHEALLCAGLEAPLTKEIPSYIDIPDLPPIDLSLLGGCFAIKPVHGGGGKGVIPMANTWDQVLLARQEYPNDQYLLQAHVIPTMLGNRPAWFRLIYCVGRVFSFWWDPCTHIYTLLTAGEIQSYNLERLAYLSQRMAQLCRLELFSTEVALTPDGHFLLVDYINDPIDLRPQSKAAEGVPDDVIAEIGCELARYIRNHIIHSELSAIESVYRY
jgi:hypothetical protein